MHRRHSQLTGLPVTDRTACKNSLSIGSKRRGVEGLTLGNPGLDFTVWYPGHLITWRNHCWLLWPYISISMFGLIGDFPNCNVSVKVYIISQWFAYIEKFTNSLVKGDAIGEPGVVRHDISQGGDWWIFRFVRPWPAAFQEKNLLLSFWAPAWNKKWRERTHWTP